MTNAPGKNFLKVAGILNIINGGISIIMFFKWVNNNFLILVLNTGPGPVFFAATLAALVILFAGIMGVKYCATLEKAKVLLTLAVIELIVFAICVLYNFSGISTLFLAVSILYLIGALKNKKAFEANLAASSEDNVE
jgi:hypothetical protein